MSIIEDDLDISNYRHMKHLKILQKINALTWGSSIGEYNATKEQKEFILSTLREFYKSGYLDGFRNGRSKEWSYDAVRPGHPKNTYPGFDIYNEDKEDE